MQMNTFVIPPVTSLYAHNLSRDKSRQRLESISPRPQLHYKKISSPASGHLNLSRFPGQDVNLRTKVRKKINCSVGHFSFLYTHEW